MVPITKHTHSICVLRYKEGRYPENMDTLTISNNSMMETQVDFYFRYDENATTFLLDPPSMSLQPSESNVCTENIMCSHTLTDNKYNVYTQQYRVHYALTMYSVIEHCYYLFEYPTYRF